MRFSTIGQGLVVSLLLVLSLRVSGVADGLPSFMSTSYELDTLVHGDTVALAYPFVNTTGDSLIVDDLRASCGCISSIDGGSRHGPGDTGVVVITFSSSGQRDGGTYDLAVTFRTPDDTARMSTSTAALSFTVPIRHEVRFMPGMLCGMQTQRDRSPMLSGSLVNNSDTSVRVTAIAADSSSPLQVLTPQLPVTLASAEQLPFVVMLPAGAPVAEQGDIRSRISAVVENAKYTEHSCEVYLFLD